jgi:outer membrane protein assembly factor BamB
VVKGKGQVIFGGGDGWLYGLSAEHGEIVWKFFCNPKKSTYKPTGLSDRCDFLGTPVVYDNKVYVGVGRDPENHGTGLGHFWCIDITKTGDISAVNDNFDPKAAVNKNSGLVWHFGGPTNSTKAGDKDYFFGRTCSTCAIHEDLVYITDLDGFLYCFDAQSGKEYWEHDLKSVTWASPFYADGKVYIGTNDSEVHVLAHGKQKKVLGSNEMDKAVRGPLVAADGVLYVQTDYMLYAITENGKK